MVESKDYDGSKPLKSSRQELFCRGIVSGKSQTKAYIAAGYSEKGADGHSARLVVKGMIKDRIAAIWAKIAEYAKVTQEGQSKKLAKAYQLAESQDNAQAMVRACEVQNRLYGLDKQVIEQSEAQKQLSETQASEARKLADIRLCEDMSAKAEKVSQNSTQEPETHDTDEVYAMDWTNDSQNKDNTEPDGSDRRKQADQEQDGQQALER